MTLPRMTRIFGRITLAFTLGMGLLAQANPLAAQVQTLVDPTTLAAALENPAPGTVLALKGGDYGNLLFKDGGGSADQPLTLIAADPADPPRFRGLDLRDVAHVVLDGLLLDYQFTAGDPIFFLPFHLGKCSNITLRNTLIDGDVAQGVSAVDDGFGYGIGFGVRNCDKVTIEANEIRNFHRGLVISESTHVTVRGNEVHSLRMDGMNFSQVQDVLIEGNLIRDFVRSLQSPDHADMIQIWTANTTAPSERVTVRGNVLNSGMGYYTQSIFMRNERVDQGQAGKELFYRDFVIEDNVIINAHLHGISIGEIDGLVIANNTLIQNRASQGPENNPPLWVPRIYVTPAATRVTIRQNAVSRVDPAEHGADWTVRDNLLIQNRTRMEPGFYDKIFVNAINGSPRDLASFAYLAGGPLQGQNIGAPRLDAAQPSIRVGRQ